MRCESHFVMGELQRIPNYIGPAKFMRHEDDGKITVRFFGDQTHASVEKNQCLMFSNKIPANSHGHGVGAPFELAIRVIC